MNIKEFTALAAEAVIRYLPEELRGSVSVRTVEVMKINDQVMHGLAFHRGDEPAPTFYLDELFDMILLGADPEELLRGLAEAYAEAYADAKATTNAAAKAAADAAPSIPVPAEMPDLSYKNVRRKSGVRLLGKDYNREFLKTVPFRDVGNGYALIGEVQIKASDGGVFSTVITNSMAEEYNYDMDRIFDTALENAWRMNAAYFVPAEEVMSGIDNHEKDDHEKDDRERDDACWVLTANRPRFGAAALFYPGTQAMIADVLGEDYLAIPSSLHEFIIIRRSKVTDPAHLQELVHAANSTIVGPDDLLSDNILYYRKSTGELSLLQPDAPMPEEDNGLVQAG